MEIGNIIVCLVFLSVLFTLGAGTRTSDLIYYDVIENCTGMCFRRFNATHQIGCSSSQGGNVGIVFHATSNDSLDDLLQTGRDAPYIIVMSAALFEHWARRLIGATDTVNGIVILYTNDSYVPDQYSPDYSCPNHYGPFGSGDCQPWNPHGSGLMFEDYPFPVVTLVHNASVTDFLIHECYERYNKPDANGTMPGSQRCGMLIKAAMYGAKDTPTCIRRSNTIRNLSPQGYCDPLGNENIFASIRPMKHNEKSPVILVATRYDSFSMYDGQYPGADTATLSFITLFAVAEALGRVRQDLNSTNKHVLLVIFHGEAFDYIGSSRMVYDISKGWMNFSIDDIEMFIEIGQIGLDTSLDNVTLWLHSGLNASQQVTEFKKLLTATADRQQLSISDAASQPLPPASLQTFMKQRPDMPGLVITNHHRQFTNRYYNSMFDVAKSAGLHYPQSLSESEKYNYVGDLAVHIERLATTIAQSVYQQATGSSSVPHNCSANNVTVANMLYCFTVDPDCELLNSTYKDDKMVKPLKDNKILIMSHYVSVRGSSADVYNVYLLARFLGERVDAATGNTDLCAALQKNDSDQSGYMYFTMRGPLVNASDPQGPRVSWCMKAAANHSAAESPAFLDEDYDWSSNRYSSWSESRWSNNAFQVRIFLMPSHKQELVTFFVGLVLFVLSFAAVYFIERNSAILLLPATT